MVFQNNSISCRKSVTKVTGELRSLTGIKRLLRIEPKKGNCYLGAGEIKERAPGFPALSRDTILPVPSRV